MSNLNHQEDWPVAIDNNYRLLEPIAPKYPTCWCCNTVAYKKCNVCNAQLCLEHECRVPFEKEWCVTFSEKIYYSTLVLCSDCQEKETSQRHFRLMTGIFAIILFFLAFLIIVISQAS